MYPGNIPRDLQLILKIISKKAKMKAMPQASSGPPGPPGLPAWALMVLNVVPFCVVY